MNSNWSYSPETLNSGQNQQFFCLVRTWNLMDDLEKNIRTHFLCYFKLWHHFLATGEFKLELQSGPNSGQNLRFLSHINLILTDDPENNRTPFPCYVSSFVRHFIAIGVFKLELQSRNAQFGSKSTVFCPMRLWHLTDDGQTDGWTERSVLRGAWSQLRKD